MGYRRLFTPGHSFHLQPPRPFSFLFTSPLLTGWLNLPYYYGSSKNQFCRGRKRGLCVLDRVRGVRMLTTPATSRVTTIGQFWYTHGKLVFLQTSCKRQSKTHSVKPREKGPQEILLYVTLLCHTYKPGNPNFLRKLEVQEPSLHILEETRVGLECGMSI